MPKRSGFTLIELLVVITIIAILSAIGMAVYSSVTMKARDARRKLDLQSIAQALEVYYQKNSSYPITAAWVTSNNLKWITGFDALVSQYISSMPMDPKNNDGTPIYGAYYGYAYWTGGNTPVSGCPPEGQFYILVALLENQNDPDRNGMKNYKWCNGQDLSTFFGTWSQYTYVITSK